MNDPEVVCDEKCPLCGGELMSEPTNSGWPDGGYVFCANSSCGCHGEIKHDDDGMVYVEICEGVLDAAQRFKELTKLLMEAVPCMGSFGDLKERIYRALKLTPMDPQPRWEEEPCKDPKGTWSARYRGCHWGYVGPEETEETEVHTPPSEEHRPVCRYGVWYWTTAPAEQVKGES